MGITLLIDNPREVDLFLIISLLGAVVFPLLIFFFPRIAAEVAVRIIRFFIVWAYISFAFYTIIFTSPVLLFCWRKASEYLA